MDAVREQPRRGAMLGLAAAGILRPLIPRRYRPVQAARVARALLAGVLASPAGERVLESEQLQD